ncbi:MAG: hypothetical protein JWM95_4281 [Gemmatimonadetes bacterium]|nr:hypothetical protein [Gemmatimonadota bacterium]
MSAISVTQMEKLVSEERKGVGARLGHCLVVYELVDHGLEFYRVVNEGEGFRPRTKKFLAPDPEYASYAVNMARSLRFQFTERFEHMSLGHEFDLTFTLSYRAGDARLLVDGLTNDPLRRVREEVTRLLGGKAMAIEWNVIVDSKVRNNFASLLPRIMGETELVHIREFARDTGVEVLGIDAALHLTTEDVNVVKQGVVDEREAEFEKTATARAVRTSAAGTQIRNADRKSQHDQELYDIELENEVIEKRYRLRVEKQIHENRLASLELAAQFQVQGMAAAAKALSQVAEEIRSPEQLVRASELVAQALQVSFGGAPAPDARIGMLNGSSRTQRLVAGNAGELATELGIAQEKAASIPDELDRKLFVALVMHWFAELQLGRGADKEIVDRYRAELESIGIRLRSGLSPELFDYVQRILDGDAMIRRFA